MPIRGFHIEAESQVLVMVQQPSVTGCCDVQHQPALVPRSERLKIQKEQVRLPVGVLLDHFEHADVEGCVERVGTGFFVDPELSSCDSLPSRDLG